MLLNSPNSYSPRSSGSHRSQRSSHSPHRRPRSLPSTIMNNPFPRYNSGMYGGIPGPPLMTVNQSNAPGTLMVNGSATPNVSRRSSSYASSTSASRNSYRSSPSTQSTSLESCVSISPSSVRQYGRSFTQNPAMLNLDSRYRCRNVSGYNRNLCSTTHTSGYNSISLNSSNSTYSPTNQNDSLYPINRNTTNVSGLENVRTVLPVTRRSSDASKYDSASRTYQRGSGYRRQSDIHLSVDSAAISRRSTIVTPCATSQLVFPTNSYSSPKSPYLSPSCIHYPPSHCISGLAITGSASCCSGESACYPPNIASVTNHFTSNALAAYRPRKSSHDSTYFNDTLDYPAISSSTTTATLSPLNSAGIISRSSSSTNIPSLFRSHRGKHSTLAQYLPISGLTSAKPRAHLRFASHVNSSPALRALGSKSSLDGSVASHFSRGNGSRGSRNSAVTSLIRSPSVRSSESSSARASPSPGCSTSDILYPSSLEVDAHVEALKAVSGAMSIGNPSDHNYSDYTFQPFPIAYTSSLPANPPPTSSPSHIAQLLILPQRADKSDHYYRHTCVTKHSSRKPDYIDLSSTSAQALKHKANKVSAIPSTPGTLSEQNPQPCPSGQIIISSRSSSSKALPPLPQTQPSNTKSSSESDSAPISLNSNSTSHILSTKEHLSMLSSQTASLSTLTGTAPLPLPQDSFAISSSSFLDSASSGTSSIRSVVLDPEYGSPSTVNSRPQSNGKTDNMAMSTDDSTFHPCMSREKVPELQSFYSESANNLLHTSYQLSSSPDTVYEHRKSTIGLSSERHRSTVNLVSCTESDDAAMINANVTDVLDLDLDVCDTSPTHPEYNSKNSRLQSTELSGDLTHDELPLRLSPTHTLSLTSHNRTGSKVNIPLFRRFAVTFRGALNRSKSVQRSSSYFTSYTHSGCMPSPLPFGSAFTNSEPQEPGPRKSFRRELLKSAVTNEPDQDSNSRGAHSKSTFGLKVENDEIGGKSKFNAGRSKSFHSAKRRSFTYHGRQDGTQRLNNTPGTSAFCGPFKLKSGPPVLSFCVPSTAISVDYSFDNENTVVPLPPSLESRIVRDSSAGSCLTNAESTCTNDTSLTPMTNPSSTTPPSASILNSTSKLSGVDESEGLKVDAPCDEAKNTDGITNGKAHKSGEKSAESEKLVSGKLPVNATHSNDSSSQLIPGIKRACNQARVNGKRISTLFVVGQVDSATDDKFQNPHMKTISPDNASAGPDGRETIVDSILNQNSNARISLGEKSLTSKAGHKLKFPSSVYPNRKKRGIFGSKQAAANTGYPATRSSTFGFVSALSLGRKSFTSKDGNMAGLSSSANSNASSLPPLPKFTSAPLIDLSWSFDKTTFGDTSESTNDTNGGNANTGTEALTGLNNEEAWFKGIGI